MDVHFSSKKQDWETPRELFDKYNEYFKFTLDVCASPENAKCKNYYTESDDALSKEWEGICWMNPPYGREIGKWMKKAYYSACKNNAQVVCLVPSRTDTAWWHDYAMKGKVIFLRGRLKFGGSKNSAPFPSAIVIFSSIPLHAKNCTCTYCE